MSRNPTKLKVAKDVSINEEAQNAAKIDILEDRLSRLEKNESVTSKVAGAIQEKFETFSKRRQKLVSKTIYLSRARDSIFHGIRSAKVDLQGAYKGLKNTLANGREEISKDLSTTVDESTRVVKSGIMKAKNDLEKGSKIAAKIANS